MASNSATASIELLKYRAIAASAIMSIAHIICFAILISFLVAASDAPLSVSPVPNPLDKGALNKRPFATTTRRMVVCGLHHRCFWSEFEARYLQNSTQRDAVVLLRWQILLGDGERVICLVVCLLQNLRFSLLWTDLCIMCVTVVAWWLWLCIGLSPEDEHFS